MIGLAFAVAGYSSFWLILAMSVPLALVGINYMAICRHYSDGGGVYASVYHRSKAVAIVGAFLLVADYIVTASISALSGFQYVGVSHPEWSTLRPERSLPTRKRRPMDTPFYLVIQSAIFRPTPLSILRQTWALRTSYSEHRGEACS